MPNKTLVKSSFLFFHNFFESFNSNIFYIQVSCNLPDEVSFIQNNKKNYCFHSSFDILNEYKSKICQ
jgi:hypothetical protein